MSAAYTPGPWEVFPKGPLDDVVARTSPEFNEYVTIASATPSNARLIAAAPQLVEALRECVRVLDYFSREAPENAIAAEPIRAAEAARAALTAAGVTP